MTRLCLRVSPDGPASWPTWKSTRAGPLIEICVAVDVRRPNGSVAGSVFQLLRDMERKGQVVAT